MTTIYKTRGGVKTPLLSLPQTSEQALLVIKRTAEEVNWNHSVTQSGIEVRFADGTTATYSAEKYVPLPNENE